MIITSQPLFRGLVKYSQLWSFRNDVIKQILTNAAKILHIADSNKVCIGYCALSANIQDHKVKFTT